MKITDKYVFFWDGVFSQWYKAYMTIDGIEYNCAEQYMMHQKALLFGDSEIADEILKVTDPKDHKQLGRKIKGFDDGIWKKACVSIVYKGNLAKFSQNKTLEQKMVNVGNRTFVEASPFDSIWGVGLSENDPMINDPGNWKGTNLLGFVLTMVKNTVLNENYMWSLKPNNMEKW